MWSPRGATYMYAHSYYFVLDGVFGSIFDADALARFLAVANVLD